MTLVLYEKQLSTAVSESFTLLSQPSEKSNSVYSWMAGQHREHPISQDDAHKNNNQM